MKQKQSKTLEEQIDKLLLDIILLDRKMVSNAVIGAESLSDKVLQAKDNKIYELKSFIHIELTHLLDLVEERLLTDETGDVIFMDKWTARDELRAEQREKLLELRKHL